MKVMKVVHRRRQRGAAALEYILVSTFAAVVTLASLAFVGKVVRDQLERLATKMGVDDVPDDFDPFGDG